MDSIRIEYLWAVDKLIFNLPVSANGKNGNSGIYIKGIKSQPSNLFCIRTILKKKSQVFAKMSNI